MYLICIIGSDDDKGRKKSNHEHNKKNIEVNQKSKGIKFQCLEQITSNIKD